MDPVGDQAAEQEDEATKERVQLLEDCADQIRLGDEEGGPYGAGRYLRVMAVLALEAFKDDMAEVAEEVAADGTEGG